jgi:hypothetical protein
MKRHILIISLEQRTAIPLCLAVAFILFNTFPAYAVSFGVYSTGGFDFSSFHSGRSSSPIGYYAGAGLVLDTNVSANRFNYRLHIGYDNVIGSGSKFFSGLSMNRVSFIHTFGFNIIGTKQARIWMGPEVGLSCQFNTSGYKPVFIIVHGGAVLGINLNAGDNVTFGLELGMLAGLGANFNYSYNRSNGSDGFFRQSHSNDNDRSIAKVESFTRISFLFRVGGD